MQGWIRCRYGVVHRPRAGGGVGVELRCDVLEALSLVREEKAGGVRGADDQHQLIASRPAPAPAEGEEHATVLVDDRARVDAVIENTDLRRHVGPVRDEDAGRRRLGGGEAAVHEWQTQTPLRPCCLQCCSARRRARSRSLGSRHRAAGLAVSAAAAVSSVYVLAAVAALAVAAAGLVPIVARLGDEHTTTTTAHNFARRLALGKAGTVAVAVVSVGAHRRSPGRRRRRAGEDGVVQVQHRVRRADAVLACWSPVAGWGSGRGSGRDGEQKEDEEEEDGIHVVCIRKCTSERQRTQWLSFLGCCQP